MGSSAKRKKEKKKDFQKAKLKVGKTKPKASNFTDTSFAAKAIVLNQQSLSTSAPSSTSQFAHHLSLLTHRSDTQRKESLAYLTTSLSSRPVDAPLPQPIGIILSKVQSLTLDGSNGVRTQLLKLLRCLPEADVISQVEQLLLYTRAGMTHLSADIRLSSLEVLEWLLEAAGPEVVSCPGGWVKTLKTFLGVLNWQQDEAVSKWSSSKISVGKAGSGGKTLVKQLNALAAFLAAGLVPSETGAGVEDKASSTFPLCHWEQHRIQASSGYLNQLNLFGAARDEETEMYEDREERQRLFDRYARGAVVVGLEQVQKEGGEVGRAAATVRRTVQDGMADYIEAE